MKEDIFVSFPILKIVAGIVSCFIEFIICKKHKFYEYDIDDMLFASKLKVFLSGVLFILIGICTFSSYLGML